MDRAEPQNKGARLRPSGTRFATSPRIGYAGRLNGQLTAEISHLLDLQSCWLLLALHLLESAAFSRRTPIADVSFIREECEADCAEMRVLQQETFSNR
jgi:hypothetical protein